MNPKVQSDPLREAIDTCDLPALVAHYYPDSGATPGRRSATFAVWRGDRHKSFSLFISRSGIWLWRDHGTGENGNAYSFLTEIAGFSRAEAAAMLVDNHLFRSSSPGYSSAVSFPERPEGPPPQQDGLWRALNQGRIKAFIHPLSEVLLSQAASEMCIREALEQPRSEDASRIIEAAFQALKAAGRKRGEHGKIVATYDYLDEQENLLFQVVRFNPKGFAQRRKAPDGSWIWGLTEGGYRKNQGANWVIADPGERVEATFPGTRMVLYRLPQVLKAIRSKTLVFVPEGEKDSDRLVAEGLVATNNPGGANKWDASDTWERGYSESLRGANVVVLHDNDNAGIQHAQRVAAAIDGYAERWTLLSLPDQRQGEDVSDWLDNGFTARHLVQLAEQVQSG